MSHPVYTVRSGLEGVHWPAVPAQKNAALLSLLNQFDRTQWWSPQRLAEAQSLQLGGLLRHAWEHVPFYRRRFDALGFRPGAAPAPEAWRALPLLTRREIQDAGAELVSRAVPAQHGGIQHLQTSGSTGEPVKVAVTALAALMWEALTLREHLWHRRDFSARLAVIRATWADWGAPPHGLLQNDWGPPVSEVFHTGPSMALSLAADVATQAEWLKRHEPDYLLTFPTNLQALIRHFSARGERPARLREVRTISETVTPELRAACREAWGVPITDSYSSQEMGYIAIQCPEGGQYHVMAECVLVEILAPDGRPCRPGEIGRLVATRLHNFATPLIRYELRDFAEAGTPCACGRGLPTIARIVGRSRNMLTLPDGQQRWPLTGFDRYREIAPIRQFQFVQHTREDIEMRLVADRALTADEEQRLGDVVRNAFGYAFRITLTYFSGEIPRTAGGKFEEFMSRLET